MIEIDGEKYTSEEFLQILEDWRKNEKDITADDISDEDWKIIEEKISVSKEAAIKDEFSFKKFGRRIKIRTRPATWMALCGREWMYDIGNKDVKLWSLN